jgi:hypothetical protein
MSGICSSIFCTNVTDMQKEIVVKSVQIKNIWAQIEVVCDDENTNIQKIADQILILLGTSWDQYRAHNADLINLAQEYGISLDVFLADLIESAKNLYIHPAATS